MKLKLILAAVFSLSLCLSCCTPAQAQLHDEMEELFEGMLDELSPSVREKFEKAIKDNTSSIEFTKDEFRRFRSNPVNPFDGLEEIDLRDIGKSIILKFELPSLRSRRPDRVERQHPSNLYPFQQLATNVAESVVRISERNQQLALGTVVEEGIVTKASELKSDEFITGMMRNGIKLNLKIQRIDDRNDIALLAPKSERDRAVFKRYGRPVTFASDQPRPGAFVFATNDLGKVFAMGTYSNPPRDTVKGKRAFLGVRPTAVAQGVHVEEITSGSSAAKAGLRNGDVITKLDGKPMKEVRDLVNQIRGHRPGDKIEIEYIRGERESQTTAQLAAQNISGEQAAQFKMMSRLGAVPSRRSDSFPSVFQHDIPLFPEQCGGPILDINGNVIGINIARHGRAASFAIPAAHLRTVVSDLVREEVAKK